MVFPRIVHFIWLGANIPEQDQQNILSWRQRMPAFDIVVWRDADVFALPILGNLAQRATPPALASNLARAEILATHGGIYADTDIELIRSLEWHTLNYFETTQAADMLACWGPNWLADCIGAAVPGTPLFSALVQHYTSVLRAGNVGWLGTSVGAGLWSEIWRALPERTTPPLRMVRRNKAERITQRGTGYTFAYHHTKGTWRNKQAKINA